MNEENRTKAEERVDAAIKRFEETLDYPASEGDVQTRPIPSQKRVEHKDSEVVVTDTSKTITGQAAAIHREKECSKLSAIGKKHFKLVEFDTGEKILTEIRKDRIGLIMIYITGIFISIILVTASIVISSINLNNLLGIESTVYKAPVVLLLLFLSFLSVISMLIGAFLYKNNTIYVTTEKIAQVLYVNLFNRKVSQLSIGDVQDVTVTQKGILPQLFNYGTLVIETAGEQQNYTFTFVPEPYEKSGAIVSAHENSVALYGN